MVYDLKGINPLTKKGQEVLKFFEMRGKKRREKSVVS